MLFFRFTHLFERANWRAFILKPRAFRSGSSQFPCLTFLVWKEGTILDTNSVSGSTFLIVSAGSDERTQAWLGCTSQSGLPAGPHALTLLRFYAHPVRPRTDADLVALTHREYTRETHPRKMLLKEYRICMPLTVEEVSFHLQFCLVRIWSWIVRTSVRRLAVTLLHMWWDTVQVNCRGCTFSGMLTASEHTKSNLRKHDGSHYHHLSRKNVASLHLSPFYITHTRKHTHVNSLHASVLSSRDGTGMTLCHFSYWSFRFDVACCAVSKKGTTACFCSLSTARFGLTTHTRWRWLWALSGLPALWRDGGLATFAIVFGSILHFHRPSKLLKMCLKRDWHQQLFVSTCHSCRVRTTVHPPMHELKIQRLTLRSCEENTLLECFPVRVGYYQKPSDSITVCLSR